MNVPGQGANPASRMSSIIFVRNRLAVLNRDRMLVATSAVLLKNRDSLGGPDDMVGFVGHASPRFKAHHLSSQTIGASDRADLRGISDQLDAGDIPLPTETPGVGASAWGGLHGRRRGLYGIHRFARRQQTETHNDEGGSFGCCCGWFSMSILQR